ncbi:hypothetical protein ZIOFF_010376 [Zingiber officinale]|uniref:NB-ARC domain-containing protein n=1 Tax=Zingiber officinale TaxID=94328 RepID=A0A8J5HP13_ZINOF|nr:hypothetical protein ZIOFF_010376 [Zingiber officinale]
MADRYSDPCIIGHFAKEAQSDFSRRLCGFGKTTLAKTVYDDPVIVGGHFQSRAWIAVSQNYNIKDLLKRLFDKFQSTSNKFEMFWVPGCPTEEWESLRIALPPRKGGNPSMFGEFKEAMTKEFEITDIGIMVYYLGIEVDQRKDGIFIS